MAPTREKAVILIVDDDTSLCEVLESGISRHGFTVRSVTDAEQALARIKKLEPDLLILDLLMPRVSGLDLLKSLEAEGLGALPVIVMTGHYAGDPGYEKLVRSHPSVKHFIKKPLTYVDLLNRVREVLGLPAA